MLKEGQRTIFDYFNEQKQRAKGSGDPENQEPNLFKKDHEVGQAPAPFQQDLFLEMYGMLQKLSVFELDALVH